MNQEHWYDRPPRAFRDWLLLIFAAAVIWPVVTTWLVPAAGEWAAKLSGVLAPFAGGLMLAYVLDMAARFYTRKLCRGRRMFGILLAYATLLAVVALLLCFVVPQLIQSVSNFLAKLPGYIDTVVALLAERGLHAEALTEALQDSQDLLKQLMGGLVGGAGQLAGAAAGVADSTMSLFVSFAVSLYLLADKEKLLRALRLTVRAALPPAQAKSLFAVCSMANKTFGGYIKGQGLDAALVGLETFVLMTLFRLDYAPLLAVVVGVTNIIPVLGPFLGAVPGAVILLLESPIQAVIFVLIILVIQQVDGNFIAPRILGNATGLSGLWVLFAIMVGGELMGIPGMVIGVPTLAVLMALAKQLVGAGLSARGIDPDEEG